MSGVDEASEPVNRISGAIRLTEGSPVRRAFGVLTTWALWRAIGEGGARLLLRLERRGSLAVEGETLVVEETLRLLGKSIRTTKRTIALEETLEFGRAESVSTRAVSIGLFATLLGTAIGSGALFVALESGSLGLGGLGLLCAGLGVGIDYALSRGFTGSLPQEQLWVRFRTGPSLVLAVDQPGRSGPFLEFLASSPERSETAS